MSTEPTLDVAPPKTGKCACGQLHDPATDPRLFPLTGGVSPALMPATPKDFDGFAHTTKVDLHACASCWALYAAPEMDRLRREHAQGKKRRRDW
jgi:hypothetical protein